MIIIVICENVTQFNNYVDAVLNDESKLAKKTVSRYCCSRIVVHLEDIEFIYCRNIDILRGRSFDKNDRIVKVGSWYNIPKDTLDDIVAYFLARVRG